MKLELYFTKDKIINNLASYETYYQIAYGKLIFLTKVSYKPNNVDFNLALGSIYELLKELSDEEELDFSFEEELRKQVSMDVLQNFINENMELVKSQNLEIEEIVNEINDNIYFNEEMLKVFNESLDINIKKYEELISDELVQQINEAILELNSN